MTAKTLNDLINFKCGTNDTTFTQADKVTLINIFKDEISSMIVERDAKYFLIPSTFNLVANQREYFLGDDRLNRIHKLELKFTASDARMPSASIKNYMGSETESEIVKNFANYSGKFAHTIRRRALFILSGTIINVTAGGRLWSYIYPADIDDLTEDTDLLESDPSSTSFGFPRQFHELLARRVAIEYKGANSIPLNEIELAYGSDLITQLNAIASDDDSKEIVSDLPPASDLWDDGSLL